MVINLYRAARAAGLRPALLDAGGRSSPGEGLSLLGAGPTKRLEVRGGETLLNGVPIGGPRAIFSALEEGLGTGRFPAWIGFFTYEYGRHLDHSTHAPLPGLPEAVFHYYPEGWVFRDGAVLEAPASLGERLGAIDPSPMAKPHFQGALRSDTQREAFLAAVREVQEQIRAGQVYQVNLSHRFGFDAGSLDPLALFSALRQVNPSPFMGLMEGDGWALVSGSPERLFQLGPEGEDGLRTISTRPIAGTRRRGEDPEEDEELEAELLGCPKERAEHVMLLDLLRGELASLCATGSVEVSEAFTVERYSHVMHLVSEVRGRTGASLETIFSTVFPGGSITGTPKAAVMEAIAALEPVPRGGYTGSLGYVSGVGADFDVLIRSFTFAGEEGYLSSGGGIVSESEPEREYAETGAKAAALLAALGQGKGGQQPLPPRKGRGWLPPVREAIEGAQLVFVENRDSLGANAIDYLRRLGATVQVIDRDEPPALRGATHLVLGPGPGSPEEAEGLLPWVRAGLDSGLPLLGICLGHQALGVELGAAVAPLPRPLHGISEAVEHAARGIFSELPNPARFARYHSSSLVELPAGLRREAWSADGGCLAISACDGLAWGVQFHPQSILSDDGMDLLAAFLSLERR